MVDLQIHELVLKGYGPFKEKATYRFGNQNHSSARLKLLCGKNLDSDGMESNGSGKSMLVSGYIFALTGKMESFGF